MSLFKKPKKSIAQRRVFSSENDFDNHHGEKMDIEEESYKDEGNKEKKKDKKDKTKSSSKPTKSSLLSFVDEEDDGGEAFQVKKSSYSRKIHKERKKEKSRSHSEKPIKSLNSNHSQKNSNSNSSTRDNISYDKESNYVKEIQTESDGFSIRLKNSNPDSAILNGRAALCAGRDDMSSEDDQEEKERDRYSSHKFSQPDEIKLELETGVIPSAAMIYAAKKRRQKAREQGDFIAIEDPKEEIRKGKRNVREEDAEGSSGEEERVDMSAITGAKEREERREQFYSVQQSDNSEHDASDIEMNEWENQQIRKGVTGAQLISAQQESTISQYLIPSISNNDKKIDEKPVLTTAELLEQAYSQTNHEIARQMKKERKKESTKGAGIKTPQEIMKNIKDKLRMSRELNHQHYIDIEKMTDEFDAIKIDLEESTANRPKIEGNYLFYNQLKEYLAALVDCFNEKLPQIMSLEEKTLSVMSKYSKMLIERRRQDVRDQAKEITDKSLKKTAEDEERVRRAAEREGRRTRRRRDREKLNMNETHNDGMSSDDEVPDIELSSYKDQIAQIRSEAELIFSDVADEFCDLSLILQKLEEWKRKDICTYKEAFVHLSLPKLVGVLVRWEMILWNPFSVENYEDIDKMKWYHPLAMYGQAENETEESLKNDPDVFLLPTVVEKIVLTKLNNILEGIFDPLSTTQTLKLVKLMNQLANDYPSLRITSKNLQSLFTTITEKMKIALDNDVFIPIFQKQASDSKASAFFQRQFFSGIKLFRNFISFQGVIADSVLKSFAISSLLNRYLLSAMRVSSAIEGLAKAQTLVLTLPRIWLVTADKSFIESMNLFVMYVSSIEDQLDKKSPYYADSIERLKQILARLDLMVKT